MPIVKSKALSVYNGAITISKFRDNDVAVLFSIHTPSKSLAMWLSDKELAELEDAIVEYLKS